MAGRCSRGRSGVLDVQVLARGCDPRVAEGCRHARERGGGCSVLTCVRLSVTPGTAAHQAPLSTGFFRQEYWSGLLFPPPGESSPPRNRTQVSFIAGRFFTHRARGEARDEGGGSQRRLLRAGEPHLSGSSRSSIRRRPSRDGGRGGNGALVALLAPGVLC